MKRRDGNLGPLGNNFGKQDCKGWFTLPLNLTNGLMHEELHPELKASA